MPLHDLNDLYTKLKAYKNTDTPIDGFLIESLYALDAESDGLYETLTVTFSGLKFHFRQEYRKNLKSQDEGLLIITPTIYALNHINDDQLNYNFTTVWEALLRNFLDKVVQEIKIEDVQREPK